jgi:uncharacterized protein (TIGR03083 family)
MPVVPPDRVLRLYDEGVDAFVVAARGLTPDEWACAACGEWTMVELARHVLAVVGWYHDWLDRAVRGDADPPFGVADLAFRNAAALQSLSGVEGPTAVARFVERSGAYRDRLVAHWDLPFGYPRGTVTAGVHAAVAACEWHLHTWDIAHAQGRGHRPGDPAALYAATGECLAVAEGGVKGRIATLLIPLGTRLRPWEAVLRRSGRAPGPSD